MPKPKTKLEAVDDADEDDLPASVETVEIEFRGETFTVPKSRDDWDTEAFIAMNRGDPWTSLQILLGPEQWVKLRQIGTDRRTTKAFSAVFGEVAEQECID